METWEELAAAGRLADAVVAFVKHYDCVTFTELQDRFDRYTEVYGDCALTIRDPGIWVWDNLSESFAQIILELVDTYRLYYHPAGALTALLGGPACPDGEGIVFQTLPTPCGCQSSCASFRCRPDPEDHHMDLVDGRAESRENEGTGARQPSHPWERLALESPEAWAAFQVYRDLGPRRTLDEVDRRIYQPAERPSSAPSRKRRRGHVSGWSRRFRWVARAAAWDAELDRRAQAAQMDAVEEMHRRHGLEARAVQSAAMAALEKLDSGDVSAADIVRFLIEGCDMERVALGWLAECHRLERPRPKGDTLEVVESVIPAASA
jgi:hypothetical protein